MLIGILMIFFDNSSRIPSGILEEFLPQFFENKIQNLFRIEILKKILSK